MEERVPCIKCDSQLWEYIKPYLEEWGYIIKDISSFNTSPLLSINRYGLLGQCTNFSMKCKNYHDRELVTNVEEFLERAAKLKGFTYKRKDIMEKEFGMNKLEVGMIVEYKSGERRLVLSDSKGNLFLSGIYGFKQTIFNFINKLEIYKVYKIRSNSVTLHDLLVNGKGLELIWEKSKEVELTMQEIADKFGISVKQLKIKK